MIPGLVTRVRSWWRSVRRHSDLDAETGEEFRLHLELRAEDLVRRGLSPHAAARQARVEFGSTSHYVDVARQARGLQRFDMLRVSWLDFKLGFRMLARYPGITLVGGLAMAFAIWMGADTFELATQVVRPTLPIAEGDRVVGLRLWDVVGNGAEPRVAYDLARWRTELTSLEDIGAANIAKRNLITGDGQSGPVEVAAMNASGFRLARVSPIRGRTLVADDERPDAPPVAVIGYELWQSRFGGGDVIGHTVRLGNSPYAVVGVMPRGFAFPVNNSLWVPLRFDGASLAPRQGPALRVFARLAPGATLGAARTELAALGRRLTIDQPRTHAALRPEMMPYAQSVLDVSGLKSAVAMGTNVPVIMLLVLICANVALLLFARAATRETEIVVRSALGASRGRIVMQLFAEALVLGGVAALVGLSAAGLGLRWIIASVGPEFFGAKLPFWFSPSLSATTIVYAALLTVLAALIAGVMPALKVTRGIGARLKGATAGGGGLRLGGVWSVVIVAQIAVTVVAPALAYFVQGDATKIRELRVGVVESEYLTAQVAMDRELTDTAQAAFLARFQKTYLDLERRLMQDPAVQGVTFANRLPRMYHPYRVIEMDSGGTAPRLPEWPEGHRVSSAAVGPHFIEVTAAPLVVGRDFYSSEHDANHHVVVVNESFVTRVLGNRNPIGRRFRYVRFEEDESGNVGERGNAWYEIVGVVRDMGMAQDHDPKVAGIYHPIALRDLYPAQMLIHVRGNAAAFTPTLQALAVAADPALRLQAVPMERMAETELAFVTFWSRLILLVSGVALTLSLAGIYAVMSFTVSRRTREIGVRTALGATPWRVMIVIFSRPLTQVMLGVLAGTVMVRIMSAAVLPSGHYAALAAYSMIMLLVCLLACIVPTRRALRVQPTEALRADG